MKTFDRRGSERQRNRRGAALVMVTVAIAMLFAFAIIGIDLAILVTTKTQLQNAADAAALAGVSGLASGSTALAKSRAISFASYNSAVRQVMEPVVITNADITFPTASRVRVVTHRQAARGDALRTYFLRIISLGRANTVDVRATATAEVLNICATQCCKPWAVPDKFTDANGNGKFDAGDIYDPITTGYVAPRDVGVQITLKVGTPSQAYVPGDFFPIDYPPIGQGDRETGGDKYRQWIAECAPYTVGPGDSLWVEPGGMVGPTNHGVDSLIIKDPGAYWDAGTKTVKGSKYGVSPRIAIAPFFDPRIPQDPGRHVIHIVKLAAFFIEARQGNAVKGRFMQLSAQGEPCPGGSGGGGFIVGYGLVQ